MSLAQYLYAKLLDERLEVVSWYDKRHLGAMLHLAVLNKSKLGYFSDGSYGLPTGERFFFKWKKPINFNTTS